MRAVLFIASNTFRELVRQPFFLLLMTVSALFIVFLACVPYFGFGDDPKMVKDMALAVLLLSGLLMSVLCASSSVAREIRLGTALTVLSKPVGRVAFLMGKYLGLAAALILFAYSLMVAVLLSSRMAFDAYGSADLTSLGIYAGGIVAAYAAAGFGNFFLRRQFVADAVVATAVATTLSLVVVVQFTTLERAFVGLAQVDWRLIPAGILVLFALLVIAGLALASSTRLDTIPTLAVCTAFFLVGLISDYFFGGAAAKGVRWAEVVYAILPNWQQFWVADALGENKQIPWAYVGRAAAYLVAYLGAALSAAFLLFDDRELG